MKRTLAFLMAALLAGLTAGCNDQNVAKPAPQEITEGVQAEFCGMALTEHPGPKGQLFLRGQDKPLWFASVRDTFAFTMLPEMPKNIAAIYVNDMGRVRNWATTRTRDVGRGPQRGVRHRQPPSYRNGHR